MITERDTDKCRQVKYRIAPFHSRSDAVRIPDISFEDIQVLLDILRE